MSQYGEDSTVAAASQPAPGLPQVAYYNTHTNDLDEITLPISIGARNAYGAGTFRYFDQYLSISEKRYKISDSNGISSRSLVSVCYTIMRRYLRDVGPCLAVLVELRLVTNRYTEAQTNTGPLHLPL